MSRPPSPSTAGSPAQAVGASFGVRVGAEAIVDQGTWLGVPVLSKRRAAKGYRHPDLDLRLRSERVRHEALLLASARAAGVRVPVVYDCDRTNAALLLEPIEGPTLRERLANAGDQEAEGHLAALGTIASTLHRAGLAHGDLTTSNVLVSPTGLAVIDFGLGSFGEEDEDRGVDLHLVEEALAATEARAARLMQAFEESYRAAWPEGAPRVLARLGEIRQRGRNR